MPARGKKPGVALSRAHTDTAEMLDVIRSVCQKIKKIPSIRDIARHQSRYSSWEIRKAFGSWRKALVKAGVERENYRVLSDDELIDLLQQFYALHKRTPRAADFLAEARWPSPNVYIVHFGSWNAAIELAGLKPNKKFTGRS